MTDSLSPAQKRSLLSDPVQRSQGWVIFGKKPTLAALQRRGFLTEEGVLTDEGWRARIEEHGLPDLRVMEGQDEASEAPDAPEEFVPVNDVPAVDLGPVQTAETGKPSAPPLPTDLLFAVLKATANEMELEVELERGTNSKGEPVVWATKTEGRRIELEGWFHDEPLEDQVLKTGWLLQTIMGPWIQVDLTNPSNAVRDLAEALGCNDDPEEMGGDVGRLRQGIERAADARVPAAEAVVAFYRNQGRVSAALDCFHAKNEEATAEVQQLRAESEVAEKRIAELEAQVAELSQPMRPAAPPTLLASESLVLSPYQRGRLEATLDAAHAAYNLWDSEAEEAALAANHLGELADTARCIVKGVPCV